MKFCDHHLALAQNLFFFFVFFTCPFVNIHQIYDHKINYRQLDDKFWPFILKLYKRKIIILRWTWLLHFCKLKDLYTRQHNKKKKKKRPSRQISICDILKQCWGKYSRKSVGSEYKDMAIPGSKACLDWWTSFYLRVSALTKLIVVLFNFPDGKILFIFF